MTPAPNTRIKLNELNKILDEMKLGEDAVKRMAELDQSRGLQDPADVARRMRGPQGNQPPVVAPSGDALGDASLAPKPAKVSKAKKAVVVAEVATPAKKKTTKKVTNVA